MTQYQPPSLPRVRLPQPVGESYEGQPFSIGACIGASWGVAFRQYGPCIGALLVSFVIQVVASYIPGVNLVSGFLLAPMNAGVFLMYVRVARGERVEFSMMWEGFQRYLGQVGISFLIVVASFAAALPLGAIALVLTFTFQTVLNRDVRIGLIVACVALAMLASLYVSARLYFATVIHLDMPPQTARAMDALRQSWERTKPHGLGIIAVALVMGVLAMLTTLLLFVGFLLLGWPLLLGAFAVAYVMICPRVRPGVQCLECGYDVSSLPPDGVCPECGTPITPRCAQCGYDLSQTPGANVCPACGVRRGA